MFLTLVNETPKYQGSKGVSRAFEKRDLVNTTISRYHRGLFRWHCRNFFDFQNAFSRPEHKYLRKCWTLAESYREVSDGGYRHFSYYTYSHRVKGEDVNSTRIAYGSVRHPDQAYRAARRVLAHRNIEPAPALIQNTKFYGLGWDFQKEHFKVYFRTLDWAGLHPDFLALAQGYDIEEHRKEALLSVTYVGGKIQEKKLYLYPLDHLLPNNVQGFARMITDRRGEVSQEDLDPEKVVQHTYNAVGRKIIDSYREIGEELDTVAYRSPDQFTLYFP
jgi:hypothetical protein